MRKIHNKSGLAGWLIVALLLACAILVGVLIAATNDDKELELQRARERIEAELEEIAPDVVPEIEAEVVKDYGDRVLVCVRYRLQAPWIESREGSVLFNMSDATQQIYNTSEEYPYDYDFKSVAHRFAIEWEIKSKKA